MSNRSRSYLTALDPPRNRFWAILRRIFGDRQVVRSFWVVLSPSLIWGALTAVVPLLFNLFTTDTLTIYATGVHGDLYAILNYTYETFDTIYLLAIVFILSFFSPLGNFMGNKDYHAFRQTMRFAAYLSLASATLIMVLIEALAHDYVNNLIFLGEGSPARIALGVQLTRSMAFMGFFIVWTWLYVPALSAIKNNRPLIYSSVVGLIFFAIADPTFMFANIKPAFDAAIRSGDSPLTGAAWAVQERAATGTGLIYLAYFAIQPLFIYIYLRAFIPLQIAWLYIRASLNRLGHQKPIHPLGPGVYAVRNPDSPPLLRTHVTPEQVATVRQAFHPEHELLFFDEGSVGLAIIREVLALSWMNIIDQSLFKAIQILHFAFSTNFGGTFPHGAGFQLLDPSATNAAANIYYKLLVSNVEMILVFFYGVWNALYTAPQYLVANELGKRRRSIARRNAWICMNWSYVLGISFMIIIVIFGSFISEDATYPSAHGTNWYNIIAHGRVIARLEYATLWNQSRIAMIGLGFLLIVYTAGLMALSIVMIGASRWIMLGDTMVIVIFTIIAMVLHYTHFNNVLGYYFIPHLDKALKYFVLVIIMASGSALNSIYDTTTLLSHIPGRQWKRITR